VNGSKGKGLSWWWFCSRLSKDNHENERLKVGDNQKNGKRKKEKKRRESTESKL
jgi:hypothetical protein